MGLSLIRCAPARGTSPLKIYHFFLSLNRCAPARGTSPLKIYHFFLSLNRCAPARGTSPRPSFEGGFPLAAMRVACTRSAAMRSTPNPLGKGAFRRFLRGGSWPPIVITRAAGGVRKPQLLPDPDSPQTLAHRPLRCAASYTRTLDHPPREDLLTKKLLPLRGGGREGVKARPCQGQLRTAKTPPPAGEAGRG